MSDNFVARLKDRIRISIRKVSFSSEYDGKVGLVEVVYNIQDKTSIKLIDPNSGKPISQIQVYEKTAKTIDTAVEPVIEDLLYINKFVLENYLAGSMGIESESAQRGFEFEGNRCIELLLKYRKLAPEKSGHQCDVFEMDRLKAHSEVLTKQSPETDTAEIETEEVKDKE